MHARTDATTNTRKDGSFIITSASSPSTFRTAPAFPYRWAACAEASGCRSATQALRPGFQWPAVSRGYFYRLDAYWAADSFAAQGLHRINAERVPRRQITGENGD